MIYVISSKEAYAAKRLLSEARSKKYEVRILDIKDLTVCNFKVPMKIGGVLYIRNPYLGGKPDYLPHIISLAKRFKAQGGRVVDANIIKSDLGKGKWVDYQKLKKAGLPIPKTKQLTPVPFGTGRAINNLQLVYPFIAKWIYGMKAKGTFLIKSASDLKKISLSIPKKELMAQEYIGADYEYKVVTVGYKALPVILCFKFNKKFGRADFASHSVIASASEAIYSRSSDFTRDDLKIGLPYPSVALLLRQGFGGQVVARNDKLKQLIDTAERASKTLGRELAPAPFLPLDGGSPFIAWRKWGDFDGGGEEGVKKIISIAEKASRVLGRELAKIDILEKAGKFYILEVNRFPGLESFENLTGYNVFKEFVKYLEKCYN